MQPFESTHSNSQIVNVAVPRSTLVPLVANVEDTALQVIPAGNEALRLLSNYLRALCERQPLANHALRQLAETLALAIGATRDGTAMAEGRGLRAARLQEVLAEIRTGFAEPLFSAARVAARRGLSTRYVQDLLQETGHSFTEHVLELRLQKARAMLGKLCAWRHQS